MLPPSAVGFCIALFFVFIIALFTCCYRQFKRSKEVSPPSLLPRRTSSVTQRRYITTLDVRTGMPVVVDIAAICAQNSQIRIVPNTNPSINIHRVDATMYGTVVQPPLNPGRSPPPPYSEVYPQPRS